MLFVCTLVDEKTIENTLGPEFNPVTFSCITNIENQKPDSHSNGLVAVEGSLWILQE